MPNAYYFVCNMSNFDIMLCTLINDDADYRRRRYYDIVEILDEKLSVVKEDKGPVG